MWLKNCVKNCVKNSVAPYKKGWEPLIYHLVISYWPYLYMYYQVGARAGAKLESSIGSRAGTAVSPNNWLGSRSLTKIRLAPRPGRYPYVLTGFVSGLSCLKAITDILITQAARKHL